MLPRLLELLLRRAGIEMPVDKTCPGHTRTSEHFFPGQRGEQAAVLVARLISQTPRTRAKLQLPFYASLLTAVVRRRVSTNDRKSQSCLSTVRCEVPY